MYFHNSLIPSILYIGSVKCSWAKYFIRMMGNDQIFWSDDQEIKACSEEVIIHMTWVVGPLVSKEDHSCTHDLDSGPHFISSWWMLLFWFKWILIWCTSASYIFFGILQTNDIVYGDEVIYPHSDEVCCSIGNKVWSQEHTVDQYKGLLLLLLLLFFVFFGFGKKQVLIFINKPDWCIQQKYLLLLERWNPGIFNNLTTCVLIKTFDWLILKKT